MDKANDPVRNGFRQVTLSAAHNAKFYFQFCDLLRNRNLLFATARGDSSSLWITQFDFQLSSNFRFTLISSFE